MQGDWLRVLGGKKGRRWKENPSPPKNADTRRWNEKKDPFLTEGKKETKNNSRKSLGPPPENHMTEASSKKSPTWGEKEKSL